MKKKYYLKLCIVFAMLFVMGAIFWKSDTVKADIYGKWEYSAWNNQVTITKYNGADADIDIPEKINGMDVIALEYACFSENPYIESVNIPSTVTTIGSNVFYGCTNLVIVNGMENVTEIFDSAFANCTNLKQITLGNKLTRIDDGCFYNCSSLTECKLPNSLKWLENYSFEKSGLTAINIPASVSVGGQAFKECTNLKTAQIGANTNFSYGMFMGCSALNSVTIEAEGITNIGDHSFYECTSLEHISIPQSVRTIDSGAFRECTSLQKVELSYGLLTINENAFSGDIALSDITIPNSVTNIEYSAFYNCSSLGSILIPNSVTTIGYNAFGNTGAKILYYSASTADKYVAENDLTGEALTALPSESLRIGTTDTELKTVEVEIGDIYRLPYVITPSNTTDAIVWDSSSKNIASVNGIGEVYANNLGTTTIIATTTSGKTSRVDITVIDKPKSIQLYTPEDRIRVGSTVRLETTIYNTSGQIAANCVPEFSSSDPSIASVSQTGVVTGLKAGTVIITVTVRDISVSQQITIASNQIISVSMSSSKMSLRAGNTSSRVAVIRDELGIRTDIQPVYTSSNPKVATVDGNGKVTAIHAGTATITASAGNVTASYQVEVTGSNGNQPTAVSFANTSTATIIIGKTTTRKATVRSASGTLTNVTPSYTSSNPNVATVNASGKVTGLKAGTVTITARTGNLTASYKVKVVMAKLSKSGKTLTITTLPKAKVTVKASKSILGKSSKKATANGKGVAKVKFKKKVKGSVKVTITKSGYKKTTISQKF